MPLRIRSLPPLQESGSEAKEKFAALVRSKVAEREATPRWEEGASTAARRHRGWPPWLPPVAPTRREARQRPTALLGLTLTLTLTLPLTLSSGPVAWRGRGRG